MQTLTSIRPIYQAQDQKDACLKGNIIHVHVVYVHVVYVHVVYEQVVYVHVVYVHVVYVHVVYVHVVYVHVMYVDVHVHVVYVHVRGHAVGNFESKLHFISLLYLREQIYNALILRSSNFLLQ